MSTLPRVLLFGDELTHWSYQKYAHGAALMNRAYERFNEWVARGDVYAEIEMSPDELEATYLLRVKSEPPSDEITLLVGDAVHNLRSALDTLAWELCELDGAKRSKDRIYFPIVEHENNWADRVKNLTIPDEILERIKAVQPFSVRGGKMDALSILSTFSNADKHKAKTETVGNMQHFSVELGWDQKKSPTTPTYTHELRKGMMTLVDGAVFGHTKSDVPFGPLRPGNRVPVQPGFNFQVHGGPVDLVQLGSGFVTIVGRILNYVTRGPEEQFDAQVTLSSEPLK